MTDEIARARMDLITPVELAQSLSIALSTLATWRRKGMGPAYTKLGKQVFYRKSEVDAWIVGQTRAPEKGVVQDERQTELPV